MSVLLGFQENPPAIPVTKGQQYEKSSHVMASICVMVVLNTLIPAKMVYILQTTFSNAYSYGSNQDRISISSGNALIPNRRQVIPSTNDDLVPWRTNSLPDR